MPHNHPVDENNRCRHLSHQKEKRQMRMYNSEFNRIKHLTAILICLILVAVLLLPISISAQSIEKTVRVGWYESPFNQTDELGRRSGYA